MSSDDLDTSDNILNVFGLTPKDPLDGFAEIFYNVFLWELFSCVLVHVIAASIAFCRLRRHKMGRWMPLLIIVMGFISPLTGGVITSVSIAGFYRGSGLEMAPVYALCWGVAQTVILVFVSFTRFLSSL